MRKLLLLALAALSPSCGGTSTYVFSGTPVESADLSFRVEAAKDKLVIVAIRSDLGVGLGLPYSEDWVFQPTNAKPVYGKSTSLMVFATVQAHRSDRHVDEETYLKEEYVKSMKAASEQRGLTFTDVAVTKQGDHFVLEYVNEGMVEGHKFAQTHFWTFRQRDDGAIFEAHVSTVHQDPAKREAMSTILRILLGKRFIVLPKEKK
jgi:hypothetical protein